MSNPTPPPPPPTPPQAPPRRGRGRTIGGSVLFVLGVLVLLGNVAGMSSQGGSGSDPVAMATQVVLTLLVGVGGVVLGLVLVTRRPRR